MIDMRSEPLLMTMAEIAELAGVQREVVSTWRRRHPEFPAPVPDGHAVPVFNGQDVADWLIETGRAKRDQVDPDLRLYALARLAEETGGQELVVLLTALICLRHLNGDEPLDDGEPGLRARLAALAAEHDPADAMVRSEIERLPDLGLAGVADDLVEAAWGCRNAIERLMDKRNRLGALWLSQDVLAPELVGLMVELSGARELARTLGVVRVTDPHAGPGDLLIAAVDQVGEVGFIDFALAEDEQWAARLALRRLTVHGVGARLLDGDGPTDEETGPGVIVTRFPYQPAEDRSATSMLMRLDEIAIGLAPRETAIVLGPDDVLAGALKPFSDAKRARDATLRSGMVEAVIRLPAGLMPYRPGYATALWVMSNTGEPGDEVLLADVSDRTLTRGLAAALIEDVVTWRRPGYQADAHTRDYCRPAKVDDLVASQRALSLRLLPTPRQYREDVPLRIARVRELESELFALAAIERQPVRSGLQHAPFRPPVTQPIAALVRSGRLKLTNGFRPVPAEAISGDGQHRIIGSPELTGTGRHWGVDTDYVAHQPRLRLTEPGDVVVTTKPFLAAQVDHNGFSIVEFPARVLRVPKKEPQLTPRVLAALLNHAPTGGRAAGAVRGRRLEDHEIPLLPAEVARHLDDVLADVERRQRTAQTELDALAEFARIAVTGLGDGTLTLDPER
ncbi:DNA methyltransferase family protein [Actinocorallia populi]|uniref:hypothetical protein n=1 Tax=Actinocorallia populi TaxID=2079200 RepID=UPI000D092A7E|nr:hypothetical protein [Actinocorallia populi]